MRRRTWGNRCVGVLVVLGSLLVGTLAIPAGTAAAASRASGASGADTSATARASVDDASVTWGQTTTVHGSGWAAGQRVDVILYAGGTTVGSGTVAGDGSIAIPIHIPSGIGSSKEYKLAVQGPGGDGLYGYVSLPITIIGPTPTFTISSKDLRWGDTPTVTGQRYKAGAAITISLFPDNTVLGRGTAGPGDTFSIPVTIPSGLRSAKDYQVAVTGEGIDLLFHFDFLAVTIIGDRPGIHLSRSSVPRGSTLTVTGTLFLKGTRATVTLLPGYEKLGTVTVGDDGTFSITVSIPAKAGGFDPHAIVVTGQGEDGIIAYVVARVNLGGSPPSGKGGSAADVGTDSSATPPTFTGSTAGKPGTLGPLPKLPNKHSAGRHLIQIILIILLVLATIAMIILSSRKDVRDNLRRRWHHLTRRLRRAPTS